MRKISVLFAFLGICAISQAGLVGVGLTDVPTDYLGGVLTIEGSGLTVTTVYDDGPQGSIGNCTFALDTFFVGGTHFEDGSFVLLDSSDNLLLSGDVLSVDFGFVVGLMAGHGEAMITVDEIGQGALLGASEIVSITFNVPVTSFDSEFTGTSSKIDFNVPEPATMSLLGLGALALLRRKK